VAEFVRACETCQWNKAEQLHPAGLLHLLDIPSAVWADISMDFVEEFLRVNDKTVILMVVDRFLTYVHFIALRHPYTTTFVPRAFFKNIVWLHGIPSSIVSDRDPVFTNKFWMELFTMTGVKLHLYSTFHPQFDGQSEAVNKVISMCLRCLTGDRQWLQWLSWVEFCYNTSFHSSLCATPFQAVYGGAPPSLRTYTPGEARLPAVHHQLMDRDKLLLHTWERLEQAQNHYKLQYDRKHRELKFSEVDWVWLRLLHRPVASLNVAGRGKLGLKFYIPFQVLQRIGNVAYKL
jgi:hypothetical protein